MDVKSGWPSDYDPKVENHNRQQQPQPQTAAPMQHATSHVSASRKRSKPQRKKLPILIALIVAIALLGLIGSFLFKQSGVAGAIDGGKYQAVFFTNGQVYFGKLQTINSDYYKMTDIYYLQSTSTDSTNPQKTGTDQNSNVQLIKLGNEIHGPTDEMVVNRDQVLFFENLKPDGKVSQSIKSSKTQQ